MQHFSILPAVVVVVVVPNAGTAELPKLKPTQLTIK